MVLGAGFGDVCCVAVVGKPEIFNEVVAKGFEDPAVEFVTGGVGCAGLASIKSQQSNEHGEVKSRAHTKDMSDPMQTATYFPSSPQTS